MTQRMTPGVAAIAAERHRQIADEGYTPQHDAEHGSGQLVSAATAYLRYAASHLGAPRLAAQRSGISRPGFGWWPWDDASFKPGEPLDALVKAGALIAAEIDRLTAQKLAP